MSGAAVDIAEIEGAAARWYVRLHNGPVRNSVDAEFDAWLNQSALHRTCYMRCESALALAQSLRDDPELKPELAACEQIAARDAAEQQERAGRGHFAGRRPLWLATAAAVTAVAVAGLWLYQANAPTVYQTGIGERRTIELADRSTVTLNSNTALTVRISDQTRRVQMQRGEAFFSVAHDATRPFEVRAAGGLVRAVGTQFGVELARDEVTVSVLEGAVVVIPGAEQLASSPLQIVPRLEANSSVQYRAGRTVGGVRAADVRRITAWREGKLVFDNVPLSEAMAEYNRYTTRKVAIGSEEIGRRPVSGVLNIGDYESLSLLLRESLDLRAVEQDGAVLLLDTKDHGKEVHQ